MSIGIYENQAANVHESVQRDREEFIALLTKKHFQFRGTSLDHAVSAFQSARASLVYVVSHQEEDVRNTFVVTGTTGAVTEETIGFIKEFYGQRGLKYRTI